MTPLDQALAYAGWLGPVFPCIPEGWRHKHPLTKNGFKDANCDEARIRSWWGRRPDALIGVPTGHKFAVLDVDVKRPEANGYDTLADLGSAILPNTPMVHTASGGLHLYFALSSGGLRNTGGSRGRGIGPGLDWRGEGGYVIAPSPNSGYTWDPHWNFKTTALASIPDALLPRQPERASEAARPVQPSSGLSCYAEAALRSACGNIVKAPAGEQEMTLHREVFSIGTLAGGGGISAAFARRELVWAARQMRDYDARRPWHAGILEEKVERSFRSGMERPR